MSPSKEILFHGFQRRVMPINMHRIYRFAYRLAHKMTSTWRNNENKGRETRRGVQWRKTKRKQVRERKRIKGEIEGIKKKYGREESTPTIRVTSVYGRWWQTQWSKCCASVSVERNWASCKNGKEWGKKRGKYEKRNKGKTR